MTEAGKQTEHDTTKIFQQPLKRLEPERHITRGLFCMFGRFYLTSTESRYLLDSQGVVANNVASSAPISPN
eukprot:6474689-Amphidinium_carterae.1